MKINKLLLIPILLVTLNGTTFGGQTFLAAAPTPKSQVEAKQLDKKAQILADYFHQYNSPLENHAQDFVDAADQYGVDWKLVPSISGVESTFGKNSYGYNAWGWGIYGNQALGFNSWREGIYTVTSGLKSGYIERGLTDPFSMNRVYAASPTWGWRVNYFMNDLDRFSKKNGLTDYQTSTPAPNLLAKTAGASAQVK